MPDVIVIGGGLNGLIAAARLARNKLSVVVLEQRPSAGGAAATAEIAPGVRVPRLSHAIGPLRKEIVRALRLDRAPDLEFLTPDPSLTTIGADGRTISFHPDPVLTAGSINTLSSRDAGCWRDFLQFTQRIARVGHALGRRAPPSLDVQTMRERWRVRRTAREVRRLGRRDFARTARWLTMPIADVLGEWFESDLLKAAIAARAVFGNFAGPYSPGTGGMWLQRLAEDPSPVGSGATVRGAPGALSAALVQIVEQAHGEVRTNARVSSILVRHGRAAGVQLDNGEQLEAAAVISAVDPRQTFLGLVDPEDLTPTFLGQMRSYRARGVTAKINLALSSAPDVPALRGDPVALQGRLLIAPGLEYIERAFDAAKYGTFSEAPWLELSMPSITDASLAPEGQHVMSICAHFAPRHLRGTTWSVQRNALFRTVMQTLERHMPGLEALTTAREILTPEDLEREWGLTGGHIFHGEPSLDQSWIARPLLGWSRYETPVQRLFLGGAGTHPGGGLTGASGWLAAEAVLRARGGRS